MKVYKYTTRKKILEEGGLRFTQPDQLNDPLETNPNFNELIEDIKRRETAGLDPVRARQMSDMIDRNAPQIITQMLREQNSGIGFLSLTKKPNNHAMWGNYADSHQGFVLGFDGNNPFFQRDNSRYMTGLREVKYSSSRAVIPGNAALGTPIDLAELLFFTKNSDWAYEEEVRVMAKLESADVKPIAPGGYGVCLFKFPPESLLEIIFGLRTPETLKQEIVRLAAKYPKAKLLQTRLSVIGTDLDIIPYI
jgi:hypothetical protein